MMALSTRARKRKARRSTGRDRGAHLRRSVAMKAKHCHDEARRKRNERD